MAKFYGKIGYGSTSGTNGVYDVDITEREYYGDITRNLNKIEPSSQLNDDFNISNTLSIVADPYAFRNFQLMRYVEWMGTKWKIRNIEVQYPRLIINVGGIWNDTSSEEA